MTEEDVTASIPKRKRRHFPKEIKALKKLLKKKINNNSLATIAEACDMLRSGYETRPPELEYR